MPYLAAVYDCFLSRKRQLPEWSVGGPFRMLDHGPKKKKKKNGKKKKKKNGKKGKRLAGRSPAGRDHAAPSISGPATLWRRLLFETMPR